ncbi:MAG: hypothetical protein AAF335_04395 [Bacteroidota bacterium]
MSILPTWSLFFLLMAGTCHQLHAAEEDEEVYEQRVQRKKKEGSEIRRYIKPALIAFTFLVVVGGGHLFLLSIWRWKRKRQKS